MRRIAANQNPIIRQRLAAAARRTRGAAAKGATRAPPPPPPPPPRGEQTYFEDVFVGGAGRQRDAAPKTERSAAKPAVRETPAQRRSPRRLPGNSADAIGPAFKWVYNDNILVKAEKTALMGGAYVAGQLAATVGEVVLAPLRLTGHYKGYRGPNTPKGEYQTLWGAVHGGMGKIFEKIWGNKK